MKNVLFVLALWYLGEWAYVKKIKPFIVSEFGGGSGSQNADSTSGGQVLSFVPNGVAYGIDISHAQGKETYFMNKSKDSLSFVICKATEGTKEIDPDFKKNWDTLHSKGFIRGAYHFYLCDDSPTDQANHFVNTIGTLGPTDLPPIIDFETSSKNNPGCNEKSKDNILTFLNVVQGLTGRKPVIYVNHADGMEYLASPEFASYPLWIAAPNKKTPTANIPSVWKGKWAFWQKSWTYDIGATVNDYDEFNGSLAQLYIFIRNSVIK